MKPKHKSTIQARTNVGRGAPNHKHVNPAGTMRGLNRTPKEQALENVRQALRALDLAPRVESGLIPHPLDIVRAELQNVARYVELIECN